LDVLFPQDNRDGLVKCIVGLGRVKTGGVYWVTQIGFGRCFDNAQMTNSILSIKNGNDNVRIEDNCLEEELATTPILSEIRTLSLTFVMLMRFFARLNIYYKTFLTRMQCDTTPFTSCCHNVDFCIAFLRQSGNNYRHCSFCAQISPVVLKNKQ
jgi:hypothetical protein